MAVFLPGESQGRGSLVGCHLWGRTESDTTEVTEQQQQQQKKRIRNPSWKRHGISIYHASSVLPRLCLCLMFHLKQMLG